MISKSQSKKKMEVLTLSDRKANQGPNAMEEKIIQQLQQRKEGAFERSQPLQLREPTFLGTESKQSPLNCRSQKK